ncbi:YoaK family protein [Micromonospora sp. NPDC049051]|uniref:YoaK family protein n=1 Tax=Micromonospora sp. NPDC049051 TaxID=3364264 RepID=UPI0037210755
MGDSASPRSSTGRDAPDPDDSYREFRRPLLVLALTTAIAGFVDAFAFLRYGAFVANQSGNAIFLGLSMAGRHPTWPESAASLVAFAVGTGVVSQVRAARSRSSPSARGLAAAVLAMSLWAVLNVLLRYGHQGGLPRVTLAAAGGLALGALATLFARTAGITTAITYQSGTVAKTGERVGRWLVGPGRGRSRARQGALLGLLGLTCYAAGGGVGTVAQERPLWVPAWAALALSTVALLLRQVRSAR